MRVPSWKKNYAKTFALVLFFDMIRIQAYFVRLEKSEVCNFCLLFKTKRSSTFTCSEILDMSSFSVGSTVTLKSGSPIMTVTGLAVSNGDALCTWFDNNNAVQTGRFPVAALNLYSDEE